jgi:hypothetical protein
MAAIRSVEESGEGEEKGEIRLAICQPLSEPSCHSLPQRLRNTGAVQLAVFYATITSYYLKMRSLVLQPTP